jgi:hypothetical protein
MIWYWWLITVLIAGLSYTFGLMLGWNELEKELDGMLTRAEEVNNKLNELYKQQQQGER